MFKNIEGQRVPNATFKTRKDHDWVELSTDDVFAGKTVVLFSLHVACLFISRRQLVDEQRSPTGSRPFDADEVNDAYNKITALGSRW